MVELLRERLEMALSIDLTLALVALMAATLVFSAAVWISIQIRTYRQGRALVSRMEAAAERLIETPTPARNAAKQAFRDPGAYLAKMEDELVLLEAAGQGDSPRATALRNRIAAARAQWRKPAKRGG